MRQCPTFRTGLKEALERQLITRGKAREFFLTFGYEDWEEGATDEEHVDDRFDERIRIPSEVIRQLERLQFTPSGSRACIRRY